MQQDKWCECCACYWEWTWEAWSTDPESMWSIQSFQCKAFIDVQYFSSRYFLNLAQKILVVLDSDCLGCGFCSFHISGYYEGTTNWCVGVLIFSIAWKMSFNDCVIASILACNEQFTFATRSSFPRCAFPEPFCSWPTPETLARSHLPSTLSYSCSCRSTNSDWIA